MKRTCVCSSVLLMALLTPVALPGYSSDWQAYQSCVDFVPQVVGCAGKHTIYTTGQFEYLSVSPDLQSDLTLQAGNDSPRSKIVPKTAAEIKSNYIGTTAPRLPRSENGDEFPWLPSHMIDGDRSTGCMGSGWVRLDFPKPTVVSKITVWPMFHRLPQFERPGREAPSFQVGPQSRADFDILANEDGAAWKTIVKVRTSGAGMDEPLGTYTFEPVRAKQMLFDLHNTHLGIAEIAVFDERGNNAALISRGATVLVGGFSSGPSNRIDTVNSMWPFHWLLGTKWVRVGYWNDATNWSRVERVKGRLELNPVTEAAVKLAARKGLNVVLTLGYGNLLYQTDGRSVPRSGQGYEVTWTYPAPTTQEAIEGFANYCRYMAKVFKGHVHYYEIWNEEDAPEIRSCSPQQFAALTIAAANAVRAIDPSAKIIMGGTGSMNLGWVRPCLEGTGLADAIDVIAYHPYQMHWLPEDSVDPAFPDYTFRFKDFQRKVRSLGFKGSFMANEQAWKASYPQYKIKDPKLPLWSFYDVTELTKAKYLARTALLHTSLGVPVFWNESWAGPGSLVKHNQLPKPSGGADPNDPLSALFQGEMRGMCPDASFYVMRTVCTVMDGAEPAADRVEVTGAQPLEVHAYRLDDGARIVALWQRIPGEDDCPGAAMDVRIPSVRATRVVGIDLLNGSEQELDAEVDDNSTTIKAVIIRDYPAVIRLEGRE